METQKLQQAEVTEPTQQPFRNPFHVDAIAAESDFGNADDVAQPTAHAEQHKKPRALTLQISNSSDSPTWGIFLRLSRAALCRIFNSIGKRPPSILCESTKTYSRLTTVDIPCE